MSPVLIQYENPRVIDDPFRCVLQLAAVWSPEWPEQIHGDRAGGPPIQLIFTIVDRPDRFGAPAARLNLCHSAWRRRIDQVLTALNAGTPVPDGQVDLEQFVGKRMRAVVRVNDANYLVVIPETAEPVEP